MYSNGTAGGGMSATRRKPYSERCKFILSYLDGALAGCDVLNKDFVDEYVVATGAGVYLMPYGAHKCPTLGSDLSKMFKEGKLSRTHVGIQGFAGMGFPKWVYSYTISPRYRDIANLLIEKYEHEKGGESLTP